MEKLGLGDARQILAMLKGEEIASSKLSPGLAALLRQEGLLMLKNNGSRSEISHSRGHARELPYLIGSGFWLEMFFRRMDFRFFLYADEGRYR